MANKYYTLLEEIVSNLEANRFRKQIMTIGELASYLGLSKSYLYKLCSQKKIPHYKPFGKVLYFKRSEIETWVLSYPVPTIDKLLKSAFSSNNRIAKKHERK